jgi:hypothetical protein
LTAEGRRRRAVDARGVSGALGAPNPAESPNRLREVTDTYSLRCVFGAGMVD